MTGVPASAPPGRPDEGAAALAHDLRNVLTAILAAADAALAHPGADPAEELHEIRRSARHGAALAIRLLPGSEQTAAAAIPVALQETLDDLVPLLRRLAGPGVAVVVERGPPDLHVGLDGAALGRVLANLAVNAREAMPGGGRLTVRAAAVHVPPTTTPDVAAPSAGRYALIEVADTGTGIAPDLLPHIFEPFVTTKRATGGCGLGLATVRELVREAGGALSVTSAPAGGSCFRVMLPSVAAAASDASSAGTESRTVLLVDDEDGIRRLAARKLRQDGWQVLVAGSAEEAMALVHGAGAPEMSAIALLVSDVALPGMDGPDLLAALRRTAETLPAIMTSGYADADLQRRCAALGAPLMCKPYSLEELLRAAHRALRRETPVQASPAFLFLKQPVAFSR